MGVGEIDSAKAPPAIAFHTVSWLLPSQVWYGKGAPHTGFYPNEGAITEQNSKASVERRTS